MIQRGLLYWAGRVVFGPLKEPAHEAAHGSEGAPAKAHAPVTDLTPREWAVLVPMAAMALFMGIYPQPVIRTLDQPVTGIYAIVQQYARAGANS